MSEQDGVQKLHDDMLEQLRHTGHATVEGYPFTLHIDYRDSDLPLDQIAEHAEKTFSKKKRNKFREVAYTISAICFWLFAGGGIRSAISHDWNAMVGLYMIAAVFAILTAVFSSEDDKK